MKAALLHGARDVRLHERPEPAPPRPGEALIRVRAVGLCGSDLHYFREGRIGTSLAEQPLVLGHEFAGDVVALGPGVDHGIDVGARVAVDPAQACGQCEQCLEGHPNLCARVRFCGTPPTDGALQEYLAWPAGLLHPLPAGVDYEQGALLEPLGVLIHAADLAKVRIADTVAVLGAGPIGLLAVRLAKLAGAVRVFASDVVPERLQAARAFGADDAIDAGQSDVARRIRDATGGRGVDVAIECAGAPDTPGQAVDAVRAGGRVVLVGIPEEDHTSFPASSARRKGVTIKLCRRMKHTYPRALSLVRAGMVDLSPLVTHRFPLAGTREALDLLDRTGDGVLKAVVAP